MVADVPAGDAGWKGAPENSVVGHVHLRVGDPEVAEEWWHEEFGFDTVAKYGAQAVFLSSGGYHHHIGANAWHSRAPAGAIRRRSGLGWVEMQSKDVKASSEETDPWGTVIREVPRSRLRQSNQGNGLSSFAPPSVLPEISPIRWGDWLAALVRANQRRLRLGAAPMRKPISPLEGRCPAGQRGALSRLAFRSSPNTRLKIVSTCLV